ncbi:hypothetical protein BGZ96_012341 [Linnemannia gamsii]|uniref:LysM domain-containing protein n=1 Tax=Linnemannia gamsii TaxID=64522 RepID=A0ABQ7JQY3_9FUNG|nr:hypothetical protein BGZ96_012341 [Linnemannia gamsii]
MKNALVLALLSVAVSQVMAVVPIPIKECTKTVVVDPKYDACTDFARDFNITFKDLLQYNEKLRKDCMNLDTGEKMCVSINPGGINPPLVPKGKKEKTASDADARVSPKKESKDDKKTKDGKAAGAASETAKTEHAQDAKSAVKTTEKNENTPPAAAVVVPPAATPPIKQQQQQPKAAVNAGSVTAGGTTSMLLAAAGVLLSAVYML